MRHIRLKCGHLNDLHYSFVVHSASEDRTSLVPTKSVDKCSFKRELDKKNITIVDLNGAFNGLMSSKYFSLTLSHERLSTGS